MECKICINEKNESQHFKSKNGLAHHLIIHNITYQKYIEQYCSEEFHKCKICSNRVLKSKLYCSNKCKHSDPELNAKRARKEKNDNTKQLRCKKCNHITTDILNLGGHAIKHLKEHLDIIDTTSYMQYYILEDRPIIEKFKCPLCDWTTVDLDNKSGWFTTHLLKKHTLTPEQYIIQFPDHKKLWKVYFDKKEIIDFIHKNENNRIKCLVPDCGEYFRKITNSCSFHTILY